MKRIPLVLGVGVSLGLLSIVAFRYFQPHHYESVPHALATPQPAPVIELLPSEPVRANTEIFGPPHASYPAREAGGDAYPALMDRKEEKRFDLLLKILEKKRDNDPRLDRDLKNLSPAMKAAIRDEFFLRLPEERNAKGTLVFLIGRELANEEDLLFLEKVLTEAPCLSLVNCSTGTTTDRADGHGQSQIEITLAYPERVAVLSLERAYRANPRGPLAAAIRELLTRTRDSAPQPLIRRAAQDALARLKK